MLNTNEKYSKINVLIQGIEDDVDKMIEKAKSLKQKRLNSYNVSNKEDILSVKDIEETINLTMPYVEKIEDVITEENLLFKKEKEKENKVNTYYFEDKFDEEETNIKEEKPDNNIISSIEMIDNRVEKVFNEEDLVIPEKEEIENIYNPTEIIAKVYFFDGSERNIPIKNREELKVMFVKRMNKHSNLNNKANNSNGKHKPVKKNKVKYHIEKVINFIKNIIKRKKK